MGTWLLWDDVVGDARALDVYPLEVDTFVMTWLETMGVWETWDLSLRTDACCATLACLNLSCL